MRMFAAVLTGLCVMMAGSFVYAADEFGDRFGNEGATALQDKTSSPEDPVAPQDIEPAAGEATIEDELEEKMGTEVNSSQQDLGDGQKEQRDSVGEGKVRAFYENKQDERVMDDTDAAGIEVKILEFE